MPKTHPRLFVSGREELARLRQNCRADPVNARVTAEVLRRADRFLALPVVERTMQGYRMRGQEEFQTRTWAFAGAYALTGERRYVDAALREALSATKWKDWNPRHFLDTSKMLIGMAVVYDWMYDEFTAAERETLRTVTTRLGIDVMDSPGAREWRGSPSNWQQACWSGVLAAALAFCDADEERCAKLVHEAVNMLPRSTGVYGPRGGYPEGPKYWGYGTTRFIFILDMLGKAMGTDYGLGAIPGFMRTGEYLAHMTGPSGKTFNYSDNSSLRKFEPALVWLYGRTGFPDLARAEYDWPDEWPELPFDRFPVLLLLWNGSPGTGDASASLPLDYSSDGAIPVVAGRSDWSKSAAYIAAKGGRADYFHAHQDVGSFVFDLEGVRWAYDLGNNNYFEVEKRGMNLWNLGQGSDRWKVFRQGAASHNLVTIDGGDLKVDGFAPVEDFESTPGGFSARIVLDAVYRGYGAGRASRTVRLDRRSRTAAIEDRFGGLRPGAKARWSMVTAASEIRIDGNTVLFGDGRGHRAKVVAERPAAVEWRVEDISKPRNPWDTPNPGFRQLMFTVTTGTDGDFVSTVTLGPDNGERDR